MGALDEPVQGAPFCVERIKPMSSYFELLYFPKKVCRAYYMGALDAPVQGASFWVERIKLASKLREFYQKWRWSRPFSSKKSPHIFSDNQPIKFHYLQV